MHRITITIDESLAADVDALVRSKGYESRSEAMRDIVRAAVERWRQDEDMAEHCVTAMSYVFDRRIRSLAARLLELEHEHHDLVVSSTTLRMDHVYSLVTVMFRGKTEDVRKIADRIGNQRGVTFAEINVIGVRRNDHHDRAGAHQHHNRDHLAPLTS